MRLTSPRAHRIIAKRAANHRALRVDVINTFRVSAGHFACFRVVSRSQIQRFRSSARFLKGVRFPAAPPLKDQVRATGSGLFFFAINVNDHRYSSWT
jgi:hypothetical protein